MSEDITLFNTGFLGLLTILFIGLKLGKIITWSWLWVLSPIWISTLLFILLLIIVFLFEWCF